MLLNRVQEGFGEFPIIPALTPVSGLPEDSVSQQDGYVSDDWEGRAGSHSLYSISSVEKKAGSVNLRLSSDHPVH